MRSRGLSRTSIAVITVAVVVVVALGVVALAARSGGSDERPSASRASAASGTAAQSHSERSGETTPADRRFSRDEAGAVAAAVAYATAPQEWLYLSDEDVRDAAREIVVPDAGGVELVEHLVEELAVPREELESAKGTVWSVVAPLATKVERYSGDRATVAVWRVVVLSADDVAMPHSGWQTATFELEWHGDWLLAAVHETEGPVPQLAPSQQPWSARYLEEELAGFARVGVD